LENGLATTYLDIVNISYPHLKFTDAVLLFFTGVILITTQYFLDNSLWHCVFHLKPQKETSILLLTLFCVLASSLAIRVSVSALSRVGMEGTLFRYSRRTMPYLVNLYIITFFIAVDLLLCHQVYVPFYLSEPQAEKKRSKE
jgi:drug/metabolite transporter (DMT)-like permease